MFKNPIFRESALIRNAQPEPIDDLVRVTAPHEWLLLAGLAIALLAVALLAATFWFSLSDAGSARLGTHPVIASPVPGFAAKEERPDRSRPTSARPDVSEFGFVSLART